MRFKLEVSLVIPGRRKEEEEEEGDDAAAAAVVVCNNIGHYVYAIILSVNMCTYTCVRAYVHIRASLHALQKREWTLLE